MSTYFHPDDIAQGRAHKDRQKGTCASDDKRNALPCDCRPGPELVADAWAGRARMARARLLGRRQIRSTDETVRRLDHNGDVTVTTERRYFIETDPDKILDDTDREALRRAGL